jgi:hypothetical protein
MSETDDFIFGSEAPMPRLGGVQVVDGSSIRVNWTEGRRAGRTEAIDLSPILETFKFYGPLRKNKKLFATAHLTDDGDAVAWGNDHSIDMPATSIERLAEEAMTASDFAAFLERNSLTHQGAATALGRSRRQIEYYLNMGLIPRVIALACFGYEARRKKSDRAKEHS